MQHCGLFLSPNKTLWRGQNGGVRLEVIVSLEKSQCVELPDSERDFSWQGGDNSPFSGKPFGCFFPCLQFWM